MFIRLGVVVAASVAAIAVKQLNGPKPTASVKDQENDDESFAQNENEEQEDKQRTDDEHVAEEKEEEEEVKRISSINSSSLTNPALLNDEESILPEFEEFPSSKVEFPLPRDKFDVETSPEASKDNSAFETETASHSSELERLQNLVKELQDGELKLGGESLGYYGLKEQESDIEELQRQLKIKTVEINMLNVTINSLQEERKKLYDDISRSATLKKELETSRNKTKELQRQIQLDANQTKGQLLMLKQQVSSLQLKEEEAAKKDAEVEKKLKSVKELEVELVELRRKSKELQHEKRQLTVKLEAAEAKITALSSMTESEMAENSRDEVNNLRHANEDLVKQVEGLQMNRFSEVEELVYLRWVNACLRYELRNYQAPPGKISARDLSKSLSLRSQEKAKQLMLEYGGSERGQGDTDNDSISSRPSSPGSEDIEDASNDSFSSRHSSISRRLGLIQKLKRWGRSWDGSVTSSPTRSLGGGSPRSPNIGRRFAMTRGPLEALMLRNAGDDVAITTFGKKEPDTTESLNNVAESFQVMSRSVEGALEEKYPAYKDRHKLALEREKSIKERADQARAQKFGDILNLKPKLETTITLPRTLAQINEKVAISGLAASNSSERLNDNKGDATTVSKIKLAQIEKRAPRVPRPPPKPSGGSPSASDETTIPSSSIPPPPPGAPPPPPPPSESLIKGSGSGDKVHRAPELVELYQSLMKREAKKDTNSTISAISNTADVKSNMIGEIENRSAFLLAVKADVEMQGDFVMSLATEVRAASFTNIEDVASFVNWLDEELSFLVDERAVLKHFDWPEGKADALREAAFEYQDLVKLEEQVSSFVDDPKLPCESALRKMYSLLEKVEQSVYALLRTRDMAISRYKEFGIPVDWLLDSGVVGKIKLSSVQLARKYMTRVQLELDALSGSDKEPNREFLLLQGVRFAFRIHQFAGGFDAESMQAFEELRSRAHAAETGEAEKPET